MRQITCLWVYIIIAGIISPHAEFDPPAAKDNSVWTLLITLPPKPPRLDGDLNSGLVHYSNCKKLNNDPVIKCPLKSYLNHDEPNHWIWLIWYSDYSDTQVSGIQIPSPQIKSNNSCFPSIRRILISSRTHYFPYCLPCTSRVQAGNNFKSAGKTGH